MRQADDGGFHHAVDTVDLALDFLRIDIEAAGDDEVLAAADDRYIAIGIDAAEIAGDEEAVGPEFGFRLLRHPPIALEHIGSTHFDHADLSRRQRLAAVGIGDPHIDTVERKPDRAGDALALIGVRRVHIGLGHAEALENGMAGAGAEVAMRVGEQRRRARDEEAHMSRRVARQPLMLQKPGIECGHAHQGRRLGQETHHVVGVEFLPEQHRAARQEKRVGGNEKPMRMIDRQSVDEDIAIAEMPGVDESEGVAGEIGMAQHGALGAAGRARRIENGREIVPAELRIGEVPGLCPGLLHECPVALDAQRKDVSHLVALAQIRHGVEPIRHGDYGRGLGIADEIIHFRQRIGGVERQIDGAEPGAGQIKRDGFRAFVDLDRDAVAGLDAA